MENSNRLFNFIHGHIPSTIEECILRLIISDFEITNQNKDFLLELWTWLIDHLIVLNPMISYDFESIQEFMDKYLPTIIRCRDIKPKVAIEGALYSACDLRLLLSLHVFARYDYGSTRFDEWFYYVSKIEKEIILNVVLSVLSKSKALDLLSEISLVKEP